MSEPSSLPLFASHTDPGPSFSELLRQVSPHQLPGAGTSGPGGLADVPHGTTVVAIRYADGAVNAAVAYTEIALKPPQMVVVSPAHGMVHALLVTPAATLLPA